MHISFKIISSVLGTAVTYKVLKACWERFYTTNTTTTETATANANEINEILFTHNYKTCCTATKKRDANCTNMYCMSKKIDRIVNILNAAEHSVSLSMNTFSLKQLSEAVINAHNRGVNVRAIAETGMCYNVHCSMRDLSAAGIPVKVASSSTMHHKVCMVDTIQKPSNYKMKNANTLQLPEQGVLITGSMNWTFSAVSRNWENVIITSDRHLVNKFHEEFEHMWDSFNDFVDYK